MTTIISGNTPTSIGDDTTINGDITANNLPTNGSIVGYQSGIWAPDFQGTSGASIWIQNGVPAANNADIWSSFTWTRIGQTVSLSATLGVKVVGGASDTDSIVLTNLPYTSELGSQTVANTYRPFTETCLTGSFAKSATTYTSITAVVNNLGAATGIYSGEVVYFLWNNLNLAVALVQANQISASGQLYFTLQYQTDDTTWTPANGATLS